MSKIHTGIRPAAPIKELKRMFRAKNVNTYLETLHGGGTRIWTERELQSGCGVKIDVIKKINGVIYCPHCDEYFSEQQFAEVE